MPDSQEAVFYTDEKGVRVTNARVVVGSTVYSMANITSVALAKKDPSYVGQMFFLAVGLVSGGIGFAKSLWWLMLAAFLIFVLAIWRVVMARPTYSVEIGSASGKVSAVSSKERKYIEAIVVAMNEAFIKRG